MTEILGFDINEVSILLEMSRKTISRYLQKFQRLGHVDTCVIGRPYACIAMHPHEEFVIMEILLQHPEKTLTEILQEVHHETGSEYAVSTLYYYLRRNNITRKKVGMRIFIMSLMSTITYIYTLVCKWRTTKANLNFFSWVKLPNKDAKTQEQSSELQQDSFLHICSFSSTKVDM